jgi:GTP 3',8-cyclase
MPEVDYVWLPRESMLTFEEAGTVVDAFTVARRGPRAADRRRAAAAAGSTGAHRVAGPRPAIADLALTTNGILLARDARACAIAGPAPDHREPRHAGPVPLRGAHAQRRSRGGAGRDRRRRHGRLRLAEARHGRHARRQRRRAGAAHRVRAARRRGGPLHRVHGRRRRHALAPRRRRVAHGDARQPRRPLRRSHSDRRSLVGAGRPLPLADGTTFGIISSTTEPFCASCDRSRLTADGVWLLCLYATTGTDLRRPLRAGATADDLRQLISAVWSMRADRGAEERLGMDRETTLVPLRTLRKDAHLEMHTRGG